MKGWMNRRTRAGYVQKPYATTAAVRRMVKERDGHACVQCGARKKLTIHHVNPISNGGSAMDPRNMVTLCRKCHDEAHRIGRSVYAKASVPQDAAPGLVATPTESGAFPEGNDGGTGAA